MQNYYQALNLAQTASEQEITEVIDRQYNQVRRLVNHHDPNVVNKANQAITLLEEARSILLNPARRAQYDQALTGAAPNVGGLVDPTLDPQQNTPGYGIGSIPVAAAAQVPAAPAPAAQVPVAAQPAPRPVNTWECPTCHNPNPPASQFCKRCGATIGVVCPDCSRISEVTSVFCSNCGVRLDLAVRRKEINTQLSKNQIDLASAQAANPRQDDKIKEMRGLTARSIGWLVTALVGLVVTNLLVTGGLLPPEVLGVAWVATLVINWVIAAVCRVPASVMAGAGWSNLFLIGSLAIMQMRYRLFGSSNEAEVIGLFVMFFLLIIGLAVPRNFRAIAASLKEHFKVVQVFSVLSHLVSLSLIALPVFYTAYLLRMYLAQLGVVQMLIQFESASIALNTLGYLASAGLFLLAALLSARATGKINYQVRVALDDQRQTVDRLQSQIETLKRELTLLH